jgi:thiaminase
MEKITFSADKNLIQRARQRAASENRSLDDLFQEWLALYASQTQLNAVAKYQDLMEQLSHIQASDTQSRDEMNQR